MRYEEQPLHIRLLSLLITAILVMTMLGIVGAALESGLFGKSSVPLPSRFDYVKQGCTIRPNGHQGTFQGWETHVWVEYKDETRWETLYSLREFRQRKKALIDCDDWLKKLEKARNETNNRL